MSNVTPEIKYTLLLMEYMFLIRQDSSIVDVLEYAYVANDRTVTQVCTY